MCVERGLRASAVRVRAAWCAYWCVKLDYRAVQAQSFGSVLGSELGSGFIGLELGPRFRVRVGVRVRVRVRVWRQGACCLRHPPHLHQPSSRLHRSRVCALRYVGLHRGAAGRGSAPFVDDLHPFVLDEVALLRLPCQHDRAHLAHGPRLLFGRVGRVPLG